LKCDAKICKQRIGKRGRDEEAGISLEYLEDLNKYHDAWLVDGADKFNTIVIDCNEDFESNPEKQKEMITKIQQKVNQLYQEYNIPNVSDKVSKIEIVKDDETNLDKKVFIVKE
jgi:deoxyadenosine/deoxycytidine kinase